MSEIEKYYNGEIHVDFDDEIEELKADIEEYRDSTTWWSNRFNAVERDNRELRKKIDRLNIIINRIKSIYSSLCFSAPENNYIFIEKLGEVLQELKENNNGER